MTISGFNGADRYLSNFYPVAIEYEGMLYRTVEHAYQAAKTIDLEERGYIQRAATPARAKSLGSKVPLRPDWLEIRNSIMKELLKQKFAVPSLRRLLLSTQGQELIEANYWHDIYWGRCQCVNHAGRGENNLGRLLMEVREELA